MDFLVMLAAAAVPVLVAWSLLVVVMAKTAVPRRPAPAGAVRSWEEEEDRTRTKRLNAIIEQEIFSRAA